jgi:diketogulonate reductase-like aldo/keto reductase
MKTESITKPDMKAKRLGGSDLLITPVGFGAWAIGGSGWEFGWGDQDDKASVAAIHRALELGVNWIDTGGCLRNGPLGGDRCVCATNVARTSAVRIHQVRLALGRTRKRT